MEGMSLDAPTLMADVRRGMMNDLADMLDVHGFRNTGDNLLGFQMDMDAYLEETDLFDDIRTQKTGDSRCMLKATCRLKVGVGVSKAKARIAEVWENCLRYSDCAKSSIHDTPRGFAFHFLTTAPGLGVVGRIDCIRGDAEQTL